MRLRCASPILPWLGGNMQHDAGNNILFYGTAEPGVHDVIVDHCSVSWGSDTQLDCMAFLGSSDLSVEHQ